MKRPSPVLPALAAGLFAAWIGYLAFLALTTRHPIVLSHPQFLVAEFWVIAQVDDVAGPVTVTDVPYAKMGAKGEAPQAGTTIQVENLAECKNNFTKPGAYILPLTGDGKAYAVPAVPISPGYHPPHGPEYHIYADTPQTREQLKDMLDRMRRS
jgi:hypothetical protein